ARATAELLARGKSERRETLVLRIFSPYGPLEDSKRILPQLIEAGLTGRRLALTEGGQVRDFVFVEDVAEAFVNAALCPSLPQPQAIYNVCTGAGHSLRDVAEHVARVLARPLDLDWGALPYRPDEMMYLVGDNQKIRADLAWAPRYSLDEGMRPMVDDLGTRLRAA